VLNNEVVENLVLDPGYVRSLQQEGGSATFSENVCKGSYVHSKKRAHANLTDNRWRSYGIREEHRVSVTMMHEICEQWRQWDGCDGAIDIVRSPLPYYIVPTRELLDFLYVQINKYCFFQIMFLVRVHACGHCEDLLAAKDNRHGSRAASATLLLWQQLVARRLVAVQGSLGADAWAGCCGQRE
jgi:hypothetical protein